MSEILFLVEDDPEGGYTARAMSGGDSIFTEADTIDQLKANIMDALRCHFDQEGDIPTIMTRQSLIDAL